MESFTSRYVSVRTLAHLRRVKVDKLTELLNGRGRQEIAAPQFSASVGSVPPAIPPRPASVQAQAPFYPGNPSAAVNPGWMPHSQPYPPVGANGWSPYPAYNSPIPRSFQPAPVASYMPQ